MWGSTALAGLFLLGMVHRKGGGKADPAGFLHRKRETAVSPFRLCPQSSGAEQDSSRAGCHLSWQGVMAVDKDGCSTVLQCFYLLPAPQEEADPDSAGCGDGQAELFPHPGSALREH